MSSQSYQTQLLDYRRKVHPEESGQLPECFVDLESQDLLVAGAPQFEGSNYENGIKVISGRYCIITVVCIFEWLYRGRRIGQPTAECSTLRDQFQWVVGLLWQNLPLISEWNQTIFKN